MGIAVIVQRQIAATRAGVLSTVDPAGGRDDRIVIEGAFGLGESVVSGSASPDRHIVDKATLAITTAEITSKELVIDPLPEGGTAVCTPEGAERLRRVLSDDEIHRLAELAVRIEEHDGSPQDTEWAFDGDGGVWMLPSRPSTAGAPQVSGPPAERKPLCAGCAPPRAVRPAPGDGSPRRLTRRRRPRARCRSRT